MPGITVNQGMLLIPASISHQVSSSSLVSSAKPALTTLAHTEVCYTSCLGRPASSSKPALDPLGPESLAWASWCRHLLSPSRVLPLPCPALCKTCFLPGETNDLHGHQHLNEAEGTAPAEAEHVRGDQPHPPRPAEGTALQRGELLASAAPFSATCLASLRSYYCKKKILLARCGGPCP